MLTPQLREESDRDLKHLLDLSLQISLHAPTMKPFIRFSRQADGLYGKRSTNVHPALFWDFDDTLQKILLTLARTIATPEELWQTSTERSRNNITSAFVERKKWELDALSVRGTRPWFETTPREEFVFARMPYKSRLLYVGCDSGIECFPLAERGHHITAIHPDPELVEVANEWARHFRFSFEAICADAADFTLAGESFDSFMIDFYGSYPSMEQVMNAQRSLANAISDQGLGFVVATRKKYASYWFLMNTHYPGEMTRWLMKQAPLDFYYSEFDATEERLLYGVYNKSFTSEGLATELSQTFHVSDCLFDRHDPRYVLAVVQPKRKPDITVRHRRTPFVEEHSGHFKPHVWLMSKVQSICDILTTHEQRLCHYFNSRHCYAGRNPLQAVETDLSAFIDILTQVFELDLTPPWSWRL